MKVQLLCECLQLNHQIPALLSSEQIDNLIIELYKHSGMSKLNKSFFFQIGARAVFFYGTSKFDKIKWLFF